MADRGETVITRTVRLEPSVITPYGLSHGMDEVRRREYRKDEGTVIGRGRTDIGTVSVYIRLVCLSGLACPR